LLRSERDSIIAGVTQTNEPQVLILCGGMGTRISDDSEGRPKPMIEVGGRPLLWHIMKLYSHHGFTDFVLCLGYKGDIIRDYFLNYFTRNSNVRLSLGDGRVEYLETLHDERSWTVTLVETGLLTPTGGRLRRAARYLRGDRFMVTYGDGVSNVDIRALLQFHHDSGLLAAVTAVRPAARFGHLRVRDDVVEEFREKSQVDEGWINGGFFVFERAFVEELKDDSVLEGPPLESLAARGQLAVYRHSGYWRPMDTPRDRRALEDEWAGGAPGWRVWPER
jgi:glucose-1-phosphate cytidylyltransferase